MALSVTGLRDTIIDEMEGQFGVTNKQARASLNKLATALAQAIVTHLLDNAEINVGVDTTTPITPADSDLQRLPLIYDPGVGTLAPTVTKNLPGTGTGTGTLS